MSKKESIQDFAEFESLIQRVIEAETDDFFELAKLLNRNPLTDLAGADLHEVDLSRGNLQGANLRWTILSGAKLIKTNLREADLSNADLSGADLSGADLTNAILKDTSVENAKFINTKGIYERIKIDLIQKGAIVENIMPESESNDSEIQEESDENIAAFKELASIKDTPRQEKYVALAYGNVVAKAENEQEIRISLARNFAYDNKNILVKDVGNEEEETKILELTWYHRYLEFPNYPNLKACIEISNPSNPSSSKQLKAIHDPGASITCIPESAISNLGGLIYSTQKVRDSSDKIKVMKTYYVDIKVSDLHFQDVKVLGIPGEEYAVIGRDILNRDNILVDNSQDTWRLVLKNSP